MWNPKGNVQIESFPPFASFKSLCNALKNFVQHKMKWRERRKIWTKLVCCICSWNVSVDFSANTLWFFSKQIFACFQIPTPTYMMSTEGEEWNAHMNVEMESKTTNLNRNVDKLETFAEFLISKILSNHFIQFLVVLFIANKQLNGGRQRAGYKLNKRALPNMKFQRNLWTNLDCGSWRANTENTE